MVLHVVGVLLTAEIEETERVEEKAKERKEDTMFWNTLTVTTLVASLVSLVAMSGAIVLIIWLLIRNARKKRAEQHIEHMAMIEKGLISPEIVGDNSGFVAPEQRLMKGIKFIAIGMAVTLWFIFIGAREATIFGLIPFFLGMSWVAAYILTHQTAVRDEAQT